MGIEQWYISKANEGDYGDIFLLNDLHESSAEGGGSNLLGTPVQKIRELGWGNDYPVPRVYGRSRALVKKLETLKDQLGIEGNLTRKNNIASNSRTLKIEKKRLFNVGVGKLPFLPLSFGIDIDFSKTRDIQLKFGAGTYFEDINGGYLSALYSYLNGNPSADIGGDFLKRNFFVKEILMARNYEVVFNSTENFSVDFNAKLEALKSSPEVEAKGIGFTNSTAKSMTAKVEGETYYLIGLTASTWKSLK